MHIQYNQHLMLISSYLLKNVCREEAAVGFLFSHYLQKHSDMYSQRTEVGPLIPDAWEQSHKTTEVFGEWASICSCSGKCYLVNNSRFINSGKAT